METILGYRIEKTNGTSCAYKLHGKKAVYTLVRNAFAPHIMFVINSNGRVCGLKGNYIFTDENGMLEVVTPY